MADHATTNPRAALAVGELRAAARKIVPTPIFDYIDCGAGTGRTLRGNQRDLGRLALVPRCFRNVATPELRMSVFGRTFAAPLGFSPTAFHRLVHSEGEIATARASRSLGLPMISSCMSSIPLETVAEASGGADLWLQTYLFKDRGITLELLDRAERAGYGAVVVTAGCPVPGHRPRNIRNRFSLPPDVGAANFPRVDRVDFNNPVHSVGVELDPSSTWQDLGWLRSKSKLPVVVKGIMSARDVPALVDLDLAGVMVSNHGGRQLDGALSTIRALGRVVEAVAGRMPVFIDGGFRTGVDALKALILGATGVFLGRPILWALAAGGQAGIEDSMNLLVEDLRRAMQLAGCPDLASARPDAAHLLEFT